MMQQGLGHARRRMLQAKKAAHADALQVRDSSGLMSGGVGANVKIRQGSSTSSWDVGNPPTDGKQPGNSKTGQDEKDPPRSRPEKVETPSLEKEYSARDLFHDKARETEERLSQKGKVPGAQDTKE